MALSRICRPLNYVDIKTRMINYLTIYEFPLLYHRYVLHQWSIVYSCYYSWTRNKERAELNFIITGALNFHLVNARCVNRSTRRFLRPNAQHNLFRALDF